MLEVDTQQPSKAGKLVVQAKWHPISLHLLMNLLGDEIENCPQIALGDLVS